MILDPRAPKGSPADKAQRTAQRELDNLRKQQESLGATLGSADKEFVDSVKLRVKYISDYQKYIVSETAFLSKHKGMKVPLEMMQARAKLTDARRRYDTEIKAEQQAAKDEAAAIKAQSAERSQNVASIKKQTAQREQAFRDSSKIFRSYFTEEAAGIRAAEKAGDKLLKAEAKQEQIREREKEKEAVAQEKFNQRLGDQAVKGHRAAMQAGGRYIRAEREFEETVDETRMASVQRLAGDIYGLSSVFRGPRGVQSAIKHFGGLVGRGAGAVGGALGGPSVPNTAGGVAAPGDTLLGGRAGGGSRLLPIAEGALTGGKIGGIVGGVIGAAVVGGYEAWKGLNDAILAAKDQYEAVSKAARTIGVGTGQYFTGIGGGAVSPFSQYSKTLMELGVETPGAAAGITGAYGLPQRFGTATNLAAAASQSKYMGFMGAPEWAGYMGQLTGMGMAGGTGGMERLYGGLAGAIERGMTRAIPAKQTFEAINKSLGAVAASGAILSMQDIIGMATKGQNLAPIGFRTGATQAAGFAAMSDQFSNILGNPLYTTAFMGEYNRTTGGTRFTAGGLQKMFKAEGVAVPSFTPQMKSVIDRYGGNPAMLMPLLADAGLDPRVMAKLQYNMLRSQGYSKAEAAGIASLAAPEPIRKIVMADLGMIPGGPKVKGTDITLPEEMGFIMHPDTLSKYRDSKGRWKPGTPPAAILAAESGITPANLTEYRLGTARVAVAEKIGAGLVASDTAMQTSVVFLDEINSNILAILGYVRSFVSNSDMIPESDPRFVGPPTPADWMRGRAVGGAVGAAGAAAIGWYEDLVKYVAARRMAAGGRSRPTP